MTVLARAAWLLGALFFATLLASIWHVHYVGLFPKLLLVSFALLAAIRPLAAVAILAGAIPVAWYWFAQRWNPAVPWAEAATCAAIAGLSVHAAVRGRGELPAALRTPAIIFGVLVIGSMIAALGVPALQLGPGFRDALATQVVREYFVDIRGFPALHAGILLLEGVLLLVLAARVAARQPHALRLVAALTVAGATAAAWLNIARLFTAASRGDDFWPAVLTLSRTVRWNVHYADFNAAGSYFAMVALGAIGLALTARAAWERWLWIACTLVISCGLWLTASRAAYLALILAAAGAVGAIWLLRSGRRLVAATAIAAATVAVVLVIAVAAPMRGNQHSSFVAADVRLGMARVAAGMIASYPAFGIGLGKFHERSGEFASPELIATFPVAVHENAHNNFLQIAAELGLLGGAAFVWLVGAALILAAQHATTDRLRLLVVAGGAAFVITWLGGHPLLVPEPSYAFWLLLGVAAGTARTAAPATGSRRTWIIAACVVAILATVPWRMRALMHEADLEHIGIGVSLWEMSPDGVRYRQGEGHATLFVPTGAFKFRVNPRTDVPVRLEVKLDGRVANIVTLAPRTWNDLFLPARSERTSARFAALELRVVDGDQTGIWITKVEPTR
jgi:O-antigen ligase